MEDWRATTLVVLAGVQLLLVPAYRSTDFEVHRNWLAITYSLPIRKWYYEATSEWTLDYPPLFAWFEWALARLAALADPAMLKVSNLEYASDATVLFQRTTVSATGLLLAAAAWRASGGGGAAARQPRGQLLFFLLVANSGLLLVDNIHFQYNGILMGLMVWSLLLANEGQFVASGVLYAVLLMMKHLFAYMAPIYFVYLLRIYVLAPGESPGAVGAANGSSSGSGVKSAKRAAATKAPGKGAAGLDAAVALQRLVLLGSAVLVVFAVSLGPFIAMGQLKQLLSRLFPFGRGLCHAYWAPNAWALYAFADKLLVAVGARLRLIAPPGVAHMAGGIVGITKFAVLPQVGPKVSAACVLLSLAPCLLALWRRPSRGALTAAVVYANLCGFVWGYHVHEKAIITVTVPLALLAVDSLTWGRDFLVLASAGHAGLFPLILGWAEAPIKWAVVGIYFAVAAAGLGSLHGSGKSSSSSSSSSATAGGKGSGGSSSGGWLPGWCRLYMGSLVPLELYCAAGHFALWGARLPFLPLMLTSVYCALGVVGVWGRMALWYACSCPTTA